MAGLRGMLYLPSIQHVRREALRARLEELAAGNPDHCGTGGGGGQFTGPAAHNCENPGAGAGAGGGLSVNTGVKDVGPVNGITHIGKVGIEDWQRNHGISRAVMESIGFNHYDQTGDEGLDPEIEKAYGTSKSAMAQMRGASAQSSGVIMTRNAIPGSPVDAETPILPQTRPDEPILSSANMQTVRGILKKEGITGGTGNLDVIDALAADPELKTKVLSDFGAKYLFPAGEGNAARVDLPPHGDNVKNFTEGKGRVYLAMEGSLKTAAVLTALDSTGRLKAGDSVIGVPSVTLWNSKELDWAGKKFLQGREVVLIPDADGVTNPAVINQARALQARLEGLGAGKVRVAAAPLGRSQSIQEVDLPSGGHEKLKGVDDFLGAGKGDLQGMEFTDRKVKIPNLANVHGAPTKLSGVDSVEDALRAISFIAGPSGTVRLGGRSIAAAIGKTINPTQKAVDYLKRMGLVKVESLHEMGPARIKELVNAGVLPRERDSKTGEWKLSTRPERITVAGDTFELRDELKSPVITIVNPAHRAVDSPSAFLADVSGNGDRIVRTPEGAERYGQSIGSVIAPDKYEEGVN